MAPKVFVIILNWNGLSDTLACIGSLAQSSYSHAKIVVVDNGSTDQSPEIISHVYPEVDVIRSRENMGFCKGSNIGIRYAMVKNADYVWLLNNDTVVEASTLSSLVEMAESSSEIGLISPIIYYYNNMAKIQFAGSYIDRTTFDVIYPENPEIVGADFQTGPHVLLWGTALLIKRSVIEKIGLLDEKYFAYWEDTEYSLRSLNSSFRNVVCKNARVYHKTMLTSMGEESRSAHYYYYFERNYLLLRRVELHGVLEKVRFYLMALATGSVRTLRCPHEYIDILLTGIWHGLKGLSGPIRKEPSMPMVLRSLLLKTQRIHPVFLVNLLTFNVKAAYHGFMKSHRS